MKLPSGPRQQQQPQQQQEVEEAEEDGGGSGRSVGAGEERLQAERTAHPVRAGRGHWLPAGLLPQGQAALRAGQLVKMPCGERVAPLLYPPDCVMCFPAEESPSWTQTLVFTSNKHVVPCVFAQPHQNEPKPNTTSVVVSHLNLSMVFYQQHYI